MVQQQEKSSYALVSVCPAFFAGAFLTNFVPHFVNGISVPIAVFEAAGQGIVVANGECAVWALLNLVVGYILVRAGHVSAMPELPLLLFFAGIAAMSIMLALTFQRKDRE